MNPTIKAAVITAVFLCCGSAPAKAQEGAGSAVEFMNLRDNKEMASAKLGAKAAPTAGKSAPNKSAERVSSDPSGAVAKQIPSVSTSCLKPGLISIIRNASHHFGSSAVITSGYRSGRHSYHGKCMAADVQISGVSPSTLAKFFRSQPGVGGVGTYGHTRSVHVDVAPRKYTWYHGRRRAG
jgi:Peptidase M15